MVCWMRIPSCWMSRRDLSRILSSLTPSCPQPRKTSHPSDPPHPEATTEGGHGAGMPGKLDDNVPLLETVGAMKVLATFRVASLETAATALRAPWRERTVVSPRSARSIHGCGGAIETYRSSGEGREHLGSLCGAQLAGQRCDVKWQQVGPEDRWRSDLLRGFHECRLSATRTGRGREARESSVGSGHVTDAANGNISWGSEIWKGIRRCSTVRIGLHSGIC